MKRNLFRPLDLVTPIGTGVITTGLCIWGALVAKEGPAILVCVITAIVFLLSIPVVYLIRASGLKIDYYTKHNLAVHLGQKNTPSSIEVEAWTEEAFQNLKIVCPNLLKLDLSGETCVFKDEEKLTMLDKFARGYRADGGFVVGYKSDLQLPSNRRAYVKSLFQHEVTHVFMDQLGIGFGLQHQKMQEYGLPY